MANIKEHPNALLLVEGNDDFHVIHSLCKRLGIDVRNLENANGGQFGIVDCKGFENLQLVLPVRFKQSNLRAIGIVVDADEDLSNRWKSIRDALIRQYFEVPEQLPHDGLILTNGAGIKVGVWIMPNNELRGMLEDFLTLLVPSDDNVLPKVRQLLSELEDLGHHKYAMVHKPKALLHTWLALQDDPGMPMGRAITKKVLNTEDALYLMFIDWMKRLFERD